MEVSADDGMIRATSVANSATRAKGRDHGQAKCACRQRTPDWQGDLFGSDSDERSETRCIATSQPLRITVLAFQRSNASALHHRHRRTTDDRRIHRRTCRVPAHHRIQRCSPGRKDRRPPSPTITTEYRSNGWQHGRLPPTACTREPDTRGDHRTWFRLETADRSATRCIRARETFGAPFFARGRDRFCGAACGLAIERISKPLQ